MPCGLHKVQTEGWGRGRSERPLAGTGAAPLPGLSKFPSCKSPGTQNTPSLGSWQAHWAGPSWLTPCPAQPAPPLGIRGPSCHSLHSSWALSTVLPSFSCNKWIPSPRKTGAPQAETALTGTQPATVASPLSGTYPRDSPHTAKPVCPSRPILQTAPWHRGLGHTSVQLHLPRRYTKAHQPPFLQSCLLAGVEPPGPGTPHRAPPPAAVPVGLALAWPLPWHTQLRTTGMLNPKHTASAPVRAGPSTTASCSPAAHTALCSLRSCFQHMHTHACAAIHTHTHTHTHTHYTHVYVPFLGKRSIDIRRKLP